MLLTINHGVFVTPGAIVIWEGLSNSQPRLKKPIKQDNHQLFTISYMLPAKTYASNELNYPKRISF